MLRFYPPTTGLLVDAPGVLPSGIWLSPTTFRVRAVLLPDVCAEEVMPDEVILRELELPTCLICGRTINGGQPRYRTPDGDVEVRCYEWNPRGRSGTGSRSSVTTHA